MNEVANCQLCGEPMPPGEEMFQFHGYSGPCPKSPLPRLNIRAKLEQIIGGGTGNSDHSIPEALRMLADELDRRFVG